LLIGVLCGPVGPPFNDHRFSQPPGDGGTEDGANEAQAGAASHRGHGGPPDGGRGRARARRRLALSGNTHLTISEAVRRKAQSRYTKTGQGRAAAFAFVIFTRAGTSRPITLHYISPPRTRRRNCAIF
jgi:hypothetical protein